MKHVDKLPIDMAESFAGKGDDWYMHINHLVLDVFQKHAFNAMQCYFAIKESLIGKAKTSIYHIETGIQTPRWCDFIPRWFEPSAEDWMTLARQTPFTQFRYAFTRV